jgi:hypothetical protein
MPRSDEKWTHRVNRDSSEFRNRNMFDVLTASVRAGNRVFAVVGHNHGALRRAGWRTPDGWRSA